VTCTLPHLPVGCPTQVLLDLTVLPSAWDTILTAQVTSSTFRPDQTSQHCHGQHQCHRGNGPRPQPDRHPGVRSRWDNIDLHGNHCQRRSLVVDRQPADGDAAGCHKNTGRPPGGL